MGKNSSSVRSFMDSVWNLLARILVFPLPTVAVINGHAFGAGLFLALACDFRVMNKAKGFLCTPEVNLGLPLRKFKWLIKAKLSALALRNMVFGGLKVPAPDALLWGVVDATATEDQLLSSAHDLVKPYCGKPKSVMAKLKMELYAESYTGLTSTDSKL
eukprot:TRINITY_DN11184_c0_g1_i1.p1 TRINITY_DN11184_c0_g1~~TRINITY_DN11184_c0_g1_i1.p1  ORF type:complete len:159 (+),score=19.24 TRINITY_DN11184_c0_g1_i1:751-1227(+)